MHDKALENHDFEMVGIGPAQNRVSILQDMNQMISPEEMLRKGEMTDEERDAVDLLRLGKTQILKRNYGFMAIFGFACVIMVTWEIVLV